MELGNAVCEAMKEADNADDCEWVLLDGLHDRIPALKNGSVDAIISGEGAGGLGRQGICH